MRRLLTAEEAKQIDQYTIRQIGVPSVVLMERAALAVAEECIRMAAGAAGIPENFAGKSGKPDGFGKKPGESLNRGFGKKPGEFKGSAAGDRKRLRILCVCGTGNNGADGVAAARILRLKGYDARILLAGNEEKGTEEFRIQLTAARNLGIPLCKANEPAEYIKPGEYGIIVDALFGVGLRRPVEGVYGELVGLINNSGAMVVAVDIPSGVRADDGHILGSAVRADVTVTFGNEKLGMLLYPGTEYCGRRVIADIGLAEGNLSGSVFTYGPEDIALLPKRPAYSNKGTFGRVLVIAGSRRMGGAALFAGLAAYRMGAGLVEIATVEENRIFLQERLPEAILTIYEPGVNPESWLYPALKRARAVVMGPGMGTEPYVAEILSLLLKESRIPTVIDADGLNVLAADEALKTRLTGRITLTPHLGEMSRLTGKAVREIQDDLIGSARSFCRTTGAVCVMKDARTVTASPDGRTCLNTSGNSGMAVGGSGDLLAGMIGALQAEGMNPFESACLGVYLHGLYGDKAKERCGERGMLASDLAGMIGTPLS